MTDGARILATLLLIAVIAIIWLWPRAARAKTMPRTESSQSLVPEEDLPDPKIEATLISPKPEGKSRTMDSTAYCLRGETASGKNVRDGIAAMDDVPFGTEVSVLSGPLEGKEYVIEDRTDQKTMLDFWMASCEAAKSYGRRDVEVLVRL